MMNSLPVYIPLRLFCCCLYRALLCALYSFIFSSVRCLQSGMPLLLHWRKVTTELTKLNSKVPSHTYRVPYILCAIPYMYWLDGSSSLSTTLCNYRGISTRFIDTIDNRHCRARAVPFNENPLPPLLTTDYKPGFAKHGCHCLQEYLE